MNPDNWEQLQDHKGLFTFYRQQEQSEKKIIKSYSAQKPPNINLHINSETNKQGLLPQKPKNRRIRKRFKSQTSDPDSPISYNRNSSNRLPDYFVAKRSEQLFQRSPIPNPLFEQLKRRSTLKPKAIDLHLQKLQLRSISKRFVETKLYRTKDNMITENSPEDSKKNSKKNMRIVAVGKDFQEKKTIASMKFQKMGLHSKFRKKKIELFVIRNRDSSYINYRQIKKCRSSVEIDMYKIRKSFQKKVNYVDFSKSYETNNNPHQSEKMPFYLESPAKRFGTYHRAKD